MIRRCRSAALVGAVFSALLAAGWAQETAVRYVHVFVALADNAHQGIVPVAAVLGNGEDAERNLYWGSAYGVKTFFSRSPDWTRVRCLEKPKPEILERCIFTHRAANVVLIADAYRGSEIRKAILDFLDATSGDPEILPAVNIQGTSRPEIRRAANLVAYIGHDGLMDFQLGPLPWKKHEVHPQVIVLACASKQYFGEQLKASGAFPLLWTTNLMAPEAYTLKSALDGWIVGESNEQIRDRAAGAYDKYQKCGLHAAHKLLVSGW